MGFKTLAIEQRSQEVWDTLRAVKSEFIIPASQMICQQVFTISSKTANHLANTYALEYKFGAMLDKTQKQLQTADKTLTDQQAVAQNHRLFLCHLIHAYLYFMHIPTKNGKDERQRFPWAL